MIAGTIKKINPASRTALLVDEEGKEISIKFAERASIEIAEDETVGWVDGELEDLEVGYQVEVELSSQRDDGTYVCGNLSCLS